jgi:methionine aminopeptidase
MKLSSYANQARYSATWERRCTYGLVCLSRVRAKMLSSEPIARSNGCAVVRTYTGHGINDLFHCSPNVPHYAKNKAVGTMKPGMVR